jgi:hypothetical protein
VQCVYILNKNYLNLGNSMGPSSPPIKEEFENV